MTVSDFGQRYRLEEEIGRGGMGSVWRAFDLYLERYVALKRMNAEQLTRPGARERFVKEAVAIAKLHDPHVVEIHDFGFEEDVPFFVMELLEGEDLDARFQRLGPLAPAFVVWLVEQIGRALDAAHGAGMVHRDLKPENVFLARDGSGAETVKVLDFGLAALVTTLGDEASEARRSILGTPHYMSPEQVRGSQWIDHRSDLWSLAVLAYRGLTGRLPFPGDGIGGVLLAVSIDEAPAPSATVPGLSPALDAFFERALAKDPAQRFQSGRELAAALSRAVDPSRATLKILVAEDEPEAPQLFGQQFRKEIAASRYDFVFAPDGRAALHALREHPDVDVLLTDIRMPGMDGLTLLARARAMRPELPVIVVSAYGDMANIRTAMNRGAFDFLTKPYVLSDLAATIRKAVEHARDQRAAMIAAAQNRALRMFVSRRVAEQLSASQEGLVAPADEVADVTVALLSVCGFDGLIEETPASPTLRRLNANYEVMIPEIVARGGAVDKIFGSTILAIFEGDDHEGRALGACISVRQQLAWLAAAAAPGSPYEAGVRAGVATGKVLRGCAGSRSFMRMDDALLGSAVGAAKALLDQSAPGEILVSEATRRAVEPSFDLMPRRVTLASGDAVVFSVVRRAPPLRFPGAETMLIEDEERDEGERDGVNEDGDEDA